MTENNNWEGKPFDNDTKRKSFVSDGRAILRCVRRPIFDRVDIPAGQRFQTLYFFKSQIGMPKQFPTSSSTCEFGLKGHDCTPLDCSGTLGNQEQFDLYAFRMTVVPDAACKIIPPDAIFTFKFFIGEHYNKTRFECPVRQFYADPGSRYNVAINDMPFPIGPCEGFGCEINTPVEIECPVDARVLIEMLGFWYKVY